MTTFGILLDYLINKRNFSQESVGFELEVATRTIGNWKKVGFTAHRIKPDHICKTFFTKYEDKLTLIVNFLDFLEENNIFVTEDLKDKDSLNIGAFELFFADFLTSAPKFVENNSNVAEKPQIESRPLNKHEALLSGIRTYFYEKSNNNINISTHSKHIVPLVKDFNNWLGGTFEETLIDAVLMLWTQNIHDGVFIGKSGGGKSSAFGACVNFLLENYPTVTPIYVNLEECFYGDGEDRIIKYIQKHYADEITIEELKSVLFKKANTDDKPSFVLFLDGLSDCINSVGTTGDIIALQKEFYLLNKPHIQLVFSAVNEQYPFTLGKISKQTFEIQDLSELQILNYLESVGVCHDNNTPYGVLSNPFMLSIYAKTEDFIASQNNQFKSKFRTSIRTEADILYNFFEAIAVKFAEKADLFNRNKLFFAFDVVLNEIAYYMSTNVRQHISKAEIDTISQNATRLLENRDFITLFDSYYGEKYEYRINELIEWFVQKTGILSYSEKGYTFSSNVFRNFLCAKYVYRVILVQNESFELSDLCKETLESRSLVFEAKRYIGELCEEYKNKPYQDSVLGWIFPNKTRLLLHILDLYRNNDSDNAKVAISNIVSTMAIARNRDLSGVNLSFLDLRRLTFYDIVCSRKSNKGFVSANFASSIIDQWFFKTVHFSKDLSSVKFLKNSKQIVSTTGTGSFRIYHSNGKYKEIIVCENDFIQSIDVSYDETKLLICCIDSGIYEYYIEENLLVHIINECGVMFGIAKYLTLDKFAWFTRDKKVFVYDRFENIKISSIDYSSNNICYDNERDVIIIASRSREIVRYSLSKNYFGQKLSTSAVSDSYITQVAFDDEKNIIMYCTKDGVVAEWDIIKKQTTAIYHLVGEINDFVLSLDSTHIYCITESDGLYSIDRTTREIQNNKLSYQGRWCSIDINGECLAISSVEGGSLLFNIKNQTYETITNTNPKYKKDELHIRGCSFKNARFAKNINEQFLQTLENEGAIL